MQGGKKGQDMQEQESIILCEERVSEFHFNPSHSEKSVMVPWSSKEIVDYSSMIT